MPSTLKTRWVDCISASSADLVREELLPGAVAGRARGGQVGDGAHGGRCAAGHAHRQERAALAGRAEELVHVAGGRIAAIDVLDDPERLGELDLTSLDEPAS
jgi:hypothetical protein